MKLRNMQRKMLKKAIKGVKKGALPFDIQQTENVGGGKTVMILDIARDHGMDDVLAVRHSAQMRDWSLEPRESAIDAGTRIHTDIAKLMVGIKESGPIYTMPPPGKSLALYAQCIGRVKRIQHEQAEAQFDATFAGPSLADLIEQGYLQPPPQDVLLSVYRKISRLNPGTINIEEFAVVWFESTQAWVVLLPNHAVLHKDFGAVGYATGAALEYLGRGEAEFDCVEDSGEFYRFAKCDEFWNQGEQE